MIIINSKYNNVRLSYEVSKKKNNVYVDVSWQSIRGKTSDVQIRAHGFSKRLEIFPFLKEIYNFLVHEYFIDSDSQNIVFLDGQTNEVSNRMSFNEMKDIVSPSD